MWLACTKTTTIPPPPSYPIVFQASVVSFIFSVCELLLCGCIFFSIEICVFCLCHLLFCSKHGIMLQTRKHETNELLQKWKLFQWYFQRQRPREFGGALVCPPATSICIAGKARIALCVPNKSGFDAALACGCALGVAISWRTVPVIIFSIIICLVRWTGWAPIGGWYWGCYWGWDRVVKRCSRMQRPIEMEYYINGWSIYNDAKMCILIRMKVLGWFQLGFLAGTLCE